MTTEHFREQALSFEGTVEVPHFDRMAFRIVNKRIFATLHEESGTVNIRLSPEDQSIYCEHDAGAIYPVPNKWGLQGWTTIVLETAPQELIEDALYRAYEFGLAANKK